MNRVEYMGDTGKTYVLKMKSVNGEYWDTTGGEFKEVPSTPNIALTEDTYLKGYYTATIDVSDVATQHARAIVYEVSGEDLIPVAGGTISIRFGNIQSNLQPITRNAIL